RGPVARGGRRPSHPGSNRWASPGPESRCGGLVPGRRGGCLSRADAAGGTVPRRTEAATPPDREHPVKEESTTTVFIWTLGVDVRAVFDGEVEDEVHFEHLVRNIPDAAYHLVDGQRKAGMGLRDDWTARIADALLFAGFRKLRLGIAGAIGSGLEFRAMVI